MRAWTTAILALLASIAGGSGVADARERCDCRFEVASSAGPLAIRRMTRTASGGACTFDVRLRVAPGAGAACDGAAATLRSARTAASVDPWAMPWERVTVRARKKGVRRSVLRARVRGADGRVARARLALRCTPPITGCEAIMAEPLYCVVGGSTLHAVASVDSGTVCGHFKANMNVQSRGSSLALWHGDVYSCGGSSPAGSFVATPLGRDEYRRVAGPCAATGTDGDTLLVLPRPGFDDPPAQANARAAVFSVTPPAHLRQIRAYDAPEDVPNGPHRVVADLDTIPAGSPCGALLFDTVSGHDGRVYATGCVPLPNGFCAPQSTVCVFDAATGAALPPLVLQEFTGRIIGLSAIDGGRLVVLSDDQTELPPIGYGGSTISGSQDSLHVFDVTDGARLDSQELSRSGNEGLACVTQ